MKKNSFLQVAVILLIFLFTSSTLSAQRIASVHKTKKQETLFGISKKYNVTIEALRDANPMMREKDFTLKKGMMINIPESAPAKNTASRQNAPVTVGVMLPLHDINGDGRRMTEYYRGILLALADLKREGYSVTVNAWNVAEDDDIRITLLDSKAKTCDIIFGPLYTKQVGALANFCEQNTIRLVIPFSINGTDVQKCPMIYQVYQTPYDIMSTSIQQFMSHFKDTHPVFIDCNDTSSDKGLFTAGLRSKLDEKQIKYNITNANNDLSVFAKAFDHTKRNVIVLNTARSPELGRVIKKLDELTTIHPKLSISMFGYNEWFMYTKVYDEKFRKYDTYIPSTYDYNAASPETKAFEQKYNIYYKTPMQQALPRFAITGYDHMMYFVKGVSKYGKKFHGKDSQRCHTAVQTPLRFERIGNGGYQNRSYMFIRYR